MNKYCSNFTQNKPRHNFLENKEPSLSRCPKIYRKNRIIPDSNHLKSLKKIHNSLILLIIQQQ